jgi:hypothetical protein
MIRTSALSAALAAIAVLVLGARVHTGLERVRFRVVTEPVTAREPFLTIPLPDLTSLSTEPAAIVLRLRGASDATTIRVTLDGTPVADVTVPAAQELRVDAPIRAPAHSSGVLRIAGERAGWAVTYLEVANVYGYSSGLLSFLIVPRERDAFPRVPVILLPLAFAALLLLGPRLEWPVERYSRILHRALSLVVLLLFATVLGTDRFTKYRIILSFWTFALCTAVLYAERTLQVLRAVSALVWLAVQASAPHARAMARLLTTAAGWRHLPAAVTLVLALNVSVLAYLNGSHVAGGADSYGYVSQARLWAGGQMYDTLPIVDDLPPDLSDWVAVPLGYVPHRAAGVRGQIVPSYAPGLPLLMAAFRTAGGPEAVYVVVPLLAGLTVWLTFLLGRQVHSDTTGCFAAFWLATSPAYVVAILTPMSDGPVTAFWTAALVAAHAGTVGFAALSGIATSLAILTRPNLVPLAGIVALPFVWRVLHPGGRTRAHATNLAVFVLTAATGPILVGAIFNYWYGSPLKSGYGDLETLFAWSYIRPNLARYPRWLFSTETPLIAACVAAPFALPRSDWRSWSRVSLAWLLLLFGAGLIAAYLAYIPFGTWEYLRFLLPAYPAWLVLAASLLVIVAKRTLAPRVLTVLLLVLVALYGARYDGGISNIDLTTVEARYRRVGEYINSAFSDRAVFLTMQHSGSMRFYGDREILRYDLLAEDGLDGFVAYLQARGYEPYIVLDKWEEAGFRERFEARNVLGKLDWSPTAVAPGPMRVAIYDPRDRESARPVVTRTIP